VTAERQSAAPTEEHAAEPVRCWIVGAGGTEHCVLDREALEARRRAGGFLWLDVRSPREADLAVLQETFDLHPLAVEDSLHFGQRPKLESYDGFVFAVLYGHARDEDDLVEVHCYVGDEFVLTVRRDQATPLRDLRRVYPALGLDDGPVPLVHRIADALVDSFFPALAEFEDRLELIEDDLIRRPRDELLEDVFTMRRRLVRLRRVLGPQRDLIGRLAAGTAQLPGMSAEDQRYFRDVYDHLLRLSELMDVSHDLMTSAVDVYLSASSNRLNIVIKQLTVIATIFLPLTFVTGFFGQNFGWMVEHVGSAAAFFVFGIGAQALTLALLYAYFKRQGWF
jgi:magnesium transporter